MRWILWTVAVVVGLVAATAIVGLFRPKRHTARTQSQLGKAPDAVWRVLADYEHWSEWQPDVKRVERLADHDGHTMLKMVGGWGDMPTEITVSEPPRRMVTEVDGGAFRGRWTYELEPTASGGSRVTITEEGEVDNPLFRAMMLFHDNYATMFGYHRALGTRLGETVQPVKADLVSN